MQRKMRYQTQSRYSEA